MKSLLAVAIGEKEEQETADENWVEGGNKVGEGGEYGGRSFVLFGVGEACSALQCY